MSLCSVVSMPSYRILSSIAKRHPGEMRIRIPAPKRQKFWFPTSTPKRKVRPFAPPGREKGSGGGEGSRSSVTFDALWECGGRQPEDDFQ